MVEKACCFTGHRPTRLPWGTDERDPRCLALKRKIAERVEEAYLAGYRHFICGMALGCDLYFAQAVLDLREKYPDLILESAIPCPSQSHGWSTADRARYEAILDQCNLETVVQHHSDRGCMMRRNRYMVDHAQRIIAVYDGMGTGGTMRTLHYAMEKKLEIDMIGLDAFSF